MAQSVKHERDISNRATPARISQGLAAYDCVRGPRIYRRGDLCYAVPVRKLVGACRGAGVGTDRLRHRRRRANIHCVGHAAIHTLLNELISDALCRFRLVQQIDIISGVVQLRVLGSRSLPSTTDGYITADGDVHAWCN